MEEIWMAACVHFEIPADVTTAWYARIFERLNETTSPTRVYHNWTEMMVRKQEHLQRCVNKPCIVLAAFFQYYHYDGNRNCAHENCATFEQFCYDAQFEDEESKCLILKLLGDKSIESELSLCYDEDANLLQDLDLAILASPPEVYKSYTQLLRREYAVMNDDTFKSMRLKVLQTLLMIPNIYSTSEYQEKYEEAARLNIKQEISELKA